MVGGCGCVRGGGGCLEHASLCGIYFSGLSWEIMPISHRRDSLVLMEFQRTREERRNGSMKEERKKERAS